MPTPIHTPRINNNDDQVRLAKVLVAIGAAVKSGDPIIDLETDKATFTVESGQDGFLLAANGTEGDMVDVGSILAWIGLSPDEIVEPITKNGTSPATLEPTLKALLLLSIGATITSHSRVNCVVPSWNAVVPGNADLSHPCGRGFDAE